MFKVSSTKMRNNFASISNRTFSSHINLIKTRDEDLVRKVLLNDSYSANDFSNFLRIVNTRKGDDKLLKRFSSELPKHINYLDDLDTRKAISVILSNPCLHSESELMNSVKDRFTDIRKVKNMKNDGSVKIGADLSKLDLSIRFWIGYARLRERVYAYARKNVKINLK